VTQRLWLMTGATSGFGRGLADSVVAAETDNIRRRLGSLHSELSTWERLGRDAAFDGLSWE
jgi:hypothetical protein